MCDKIKTVDQNSCKLCKEPASRCTNCRKVWYCSRVHQKEDWSRHKVECFPGAVTTSPMCGRYLSATRDIPEGALILKEKCLFSAPNGKNGDFLLCLGCYGIVSSDKPSLCSKCDWPLHIECAQNKEHLGNECAIFSKRGILPSSKEENIYDHILVLRGCLLKLKNMSKWELVKKLEDHKDERRASVDQTALSKAMAAFVLIKCGLSSSLSIDEVDHVLGTVVVNAYVTDDNLTTSPSFQAGSFIYWNGSMPAHDCIPNCRWTIARGGELKLWSLTNIKEGDSLCHCYSWGGTSTQERQKHLLKSKFFSCGCKRCLDPTELGSFYTGIKCGVKTCSGFVLSTDPVKLGSIWACNKCKGSEMTESEVEEFVEKLRKSHCLITAECTSPSEMGAAWRETLQRLEEYNEVVLMGTKVSPTHFLVQEVEQDILVRASYILGQEEESQVLRREERLHWAGRLVALSRKCLALLEKVAPGMTTHAGRQHYYLQQGLGIIILDKIQSNSESASSQEELRQDIAKWQDVRRRGFAILEAEAPGREEWVLGQAMKPTQENP